MPIGPYVADFACMAARLVVELDGQPHDGPERQAHDRYRDLWLAGQGWRVIRFPNDIVIGGGDIAIGRIRAALASLVPSSDPTSSGHLLPLSREKDRSPRKPRS